MQTIKIFIAAPKGLEQDVNEVYNLVEPANKHFRVRGYELQIADREHADLVIDYRFQHVDTMKLYFLLQCDIRIESRGYNLIRICNSNVVIEGEPFVNMRNVQFAAKNPEYSKLLAEIEYVKKTMQDSNNMRERSRLGNLIRRRDQMENHLLDTAKLAVKLSSSVTSPQIKEAIRLFDAGDNKGALALLNSGEIVHGLSLNETQVMAEDTSADIQAYIAVCRLKAQLLKNEMTEGWFDEVCKIYNGAIRYVKERQWQEKEEYARLLSAYANFLYTNGRYRTLSLSFYYEDALAIYRQLAENNYEAYNKSVVSTLYHMGRLHCCAEIKQYAQAEKEYTEVLQIFRRLAECDPDIYDKFVALMLYCLGNLHREYQKQYSLAEKEYAEALSIYRRLAKTTSECYEYDNDIASVVQDLAILHNDLSQYSQAEKEYEEALQIRRRIAPINPDYYDEDIANTLVNLGDLHTYTLRQWSQAEKEYEEALSIYRRLAENNPNTYDANVADTLEDLANLHAKMITRLDLAVKEVEEALVLYRRLAESKPDVHEVNVAGMLRTVARIHYYCEMDSQAEKELEEALRIYERRNELHPDPNVYDSDIASTLEFLAELHETRLHQYDRAEYERKEAERIRRRLSNGNSTFFTNTDTKSCVWKVVLACVFPPILLYFGYKYYFDKHPNEKLLGLSQNTWKIIVIVIIIAIFFVAC